MEHDDHDAIIEDCKKYGLVSFIFSLFVASGFEFHLPLKTLGGTETFPSFFSLE